MIPTIQSMHFQHHNHTSRSFSFLLYNSTKRTCNSSYPSSIPNINSFQEPIFSFSPWNTNNNPLECSKPTCKSSRWVNGERGSADKGKEEDNLVLGMYAKTHEDYERVIACCLWVKWIKTLVKFERRRGGAWKNKREWGGAEFLIQ